MREKTTPMPFNERERLEILNRRLEAAALALHAVSASANRRVGRYEAALRAAVDELDRTRDSFRSATIRDLRLRLLAVLEGNATE